MRRSITLAILSLATIAISACSDTTAPRRDDVDDCRSGYQGGGGRTCP